MGNKLPQFPKVTLALGAAMVTFLCLPYPTHAQSSATSATQTVSASQDRQAGPGDDITRRDLARFDQFLDTHRETAEQVRKTPSLIDDPQFLQNHTELNAYLQSHPSVKQEISQQPDTFMRLEDSYSHDASLRNRDADGQDRVADRRDVMNRDTDRTGVANRDTDRTGVANRDADRTGVANRDADRTGVANRDTDRTNGTNRDIDRTDVTNRDADRTGMSNRDNDRRDVANFDRFLDQHREISEQVRKDPSLLDNKNFVQTHPALQSYLQDNPGVRDQLRQSPNTFVRQQDAYNRDSNMRDHDPMHDHMADFGGFLHNHSDVQKDVSRNPSVVKDHDYVQKHAELDAYLKAHPDARAELMANPQSFVHGAQQYGNASPGGTSSGAGVTSHSTGTAATSHGTGTTGSMTGTSTNPATKTPEPPKTQEQPKPNQ